MTTIVASFQLRRDTAAEWTANNPILLDGQEGWESDTGKRKVGNGISVWNSLPYDGSGGVVADGPETNRVTKFEGGNIIGNSLIYDDGSSVAIGTDDPNGSAILELSSDSQALLIPRVVNTAAVLSPANGMEVYSVAEDKFKLYQAGAWIDLSPVAATITFSDGVTRLVDNVTNDLITGINGPQTIIGDINDVDTTSLTITPNASTSLNNTGALHLKGKYTNIGGYTNPAFIVNKSEGSSGMTLNSGGNNSNFIINQIGNIGGTSFVVNQGDGDGAITFNFVDILAEMVLGGSEYSKIRLTSDTENILTLLGLGTNAIGVGTDTPSTNLHLVKGSSGAIKIVDGTEGDGKVLTSDENGVGTWTDLGLATTYVPYTGATGDINIDSHSINFDAPSADAARVTFSGDNASIVGIQSIVDNGSNGLFSFVSTNGSSGYVSFGATIGSYNSISMDADATSFNIFEMTGLGSQSFSMNNPLATFNMGAGNIQISGDGNIIIADALTTGADGLVLGGTGLTEAQLITLLGGAVTLTFSDGVTRTLDNVTNDLITGIVGNQTIIGGTVAGNNLTIVPNSHSEKGDVILDLNAIRTLDFDGVNAFGIPGEGFAFYGPNSGWGGSAMFQGDTSFFFGNNALGENTWFLWSFDGTFSFLKGYYLITNGGQVQHQVPQDYATSGKNLTIITQVDNILGGVLVPTSAGFGQQTRVALSAGSSSGLTASNVNTYWSDAAFATRTASWGVELVNNGNGTLEEVFKINPQTGATLQTVNTTTAAVDTVLTIGNNSSGVPTAGNGSGVLFNLKTSGVGAAINQAAGKLSSYWTTTNHATRQSAFAIATSQNGGTPLNRFIIEPLGTASTSYVFDAANGGTPELQFKYAGDKRFIFSGGFEIYFQSLYSQHFFSWYPGTGGTQLMNIKTTGVSIKNTTASAWLHIGAGTATAGQAPIKLTSGTNLTTAEAGAIEYNNTFHATNSDAVRRHIATAPNTTKVIAAAPYTNDGYVVINIGGTDFKVMTTA